MVQTHEERKAKQREYYQKNKERYRKNEKIWAAKNRKLRNEQARKRRADNLESHREYGREWHRKNPEKSKAAGKKYYSTHKEKRATYLKKWIASNRERYLKQQKQYNADNSKIKLEKRLEKRLQVLSHYSGGGKPICLRCKEKEFAFLTIDHIDGVKHDDGRGGFALINYLIKHDFPEGYQTLCGNCNWLKHFEFKERSFSTKKDNVRSRQYQLNLKKEVFAHYSKGKPRCNCCGFEDITALSIDHVKGRKNVEHRKNESGKLLYSWLRRNNYPKNFQVLCIMCNLAKYDNEKCPHQE